jgi:perosamine synthetase
MIFYGKHTIDEDDIKLVNDVLRSDWLTTGPKVTEFEKVVADYVDAKYGVAICNGTAALHCAMYAIGIGPGDEVIVPPMTFAASVNCILYCGGTPVFADVDNGTLLIDPNKVEEKITNQTKAIIAVDYTGQPCDYDALRSVAARHNIKLVADSCHALGADYKGKRVGTLADITVFSFHPVKHITTGEGGMVVTDNDDIAKRAKIFRNHGISSDHHQRNKADSWYYEMVDLGYNYRITDIQCALGISQMKKLPDYLKRRREIAARYDEAFNQLPRVIPLSVSVGVLHAYHLHLVKIESQQDGKDRASIFKQLRDRGIGAHVHYIPVHLHPYYQDQFGIPKGICPVAEAAYEKILSIPLSQSLTDDEANYIIRSIAKCTGE